MSTIGIGRFASVEGEASDRHLLFSLRKNHDELFLHITDITAKSEGRRVLTSIQDVIDTDTDPQNLTLTLAVSKTPEAVHCIPESGALSHEYHEGQLCITLRRFSLHAIIRMVGVDPSHLRWLPHSEGGRNVAYTHYPSELRAEEAQGSLGIQHGHIA